MFWTQTMSVSTCLMNWRHTLCKKDITNGSWRQQFLHPPTHAPPMICVLCVNGGLRQKLCYTGTFARCCGRFAFAKCFRERIFSSLVGTGLAMFSSSGPFFFRTLLVEHIFPLAHLPPLCKVFPISCLKRFWPPSCCLACLVLRYWWNILARYRKINCFKEGAFITFTPLDARVQHLARTPEGFPLPGFGDLSTDPH